MNLVTDTLLQGNIVTGSGHDGIDVASAATTLARNLAPRRTRRARQPRL